MANRMLNKEKIIGKNQASVDPRHPFWRWHDNVSRWNNLFVLYFVTIVGSFAEVHLIWPATLITLYFGYQGVTNRDWQLLPLKLPITLKNTDIHDFKPANRFKHRRARSTVHIGNDMYSGQELWLPSDDLLTHSLVTGTTGAGKTIALLSMATASSMILGGALIYLDAKAATDLIFLLVGISRYFGREDCLRFLSYKTGNIEVKRRHWERKSNTCGVFARGSAQVVQQILEAMMPPGGGENQYFRDKAISTLTVLLPAMTELRDEKLINITPGLVAQWFDMVALVKLAYPEHHENKLTYIRESTGETIQIPNRVSKPRRKAIANYLSQIGVKDDPTVLKDPSSKIPQKAIEQFGYGQGYVLKPLTVLTSTYSHIFEVDLGEIDFADTIMNDRVLGILVPATEQSKDQRETQGKIALQGIRLAMSTGMGESSEGDVETVIEALPKDLRNPSNIIIDEFAEVAVDGFAVACTQGRGLGCAVTISNQDIPGMMAANERETKQFFSNTRIKYMLSNEDVNETFEWFRKLAGEVNTLVSAGLKESDGGTYSRSTNHAASIQKTERLDFLEAKRGIEGEAFVFQGDKVVQCQLFFMDLKEQDARNFRFNRMLQVLDPTPEEIDRLTAQARKRIALEDKINRNDIVTPQQDYSGVLAGSPANVNAIIENIRSKIKAQPQKKRPAHDEHVGADYSNVDRQPETVERNDVHHHNESSDYTEDVYDDASTEETKATRSAPALDSDTMLDDVEVGLGYEPQLTRNLLRQMFASSGASDDSVEDAVQKSMGEVKEALVYTSEEIEPLENDTDDLWNSFENLPK